MHVEKKLPDIIKITFKYKMKFRGPTLLYFKIIITYNVFLALKIDKEMKERN